MKANRKKSLKGFSLVELSIVLVIISLIASSVLVGSSLIEAAEIRGQVTQLNSYKTALYAFRSTYNALAGDMRTATNFWPSATNGNGNGRLDATADVGGTESFTIFQHLSLAGYVEGSYDNNIAAPELGRTYPALKINSDFGMISGYFQALNGIFGNGTQQSFSATVLTRYKAVLFLNVCNPTPSDFLSATHDGLCGVMTPVQTKAIDDKMDDGKPATGNFIGYRIENSTAGACLTGVDGDYLSTSDVSCGALYVLK